MPNIYSALYHHSHERKHPFAKGYDHIHQIFDLNQCYGSLYLSVNNTTLMYMNDSHEELQLLVLK